MAEDTTKPSTGNSSRSSSSRAPSNIHSILSSDEAAAISTLAANANYNPSSSNTSPLPQHQNLLEIGYEGQPLLPIPPAGSTSPNISTRRAPEQDRHRRRHQSIHSVYPEQPPEPERDFQEGLKRRKLSVVPYRISIGSAEETRQDNFGLNTDEDTPLRSFPVREYPRRLSIASVLTADSSSLPSVISPATSTSWAGLASAASSTTTTNPPQWPFLSELYNPLSNRSPVPGTASSTTALGSHSRSNQQAGEESDFRTWELDIEAASSRQKTPLLRNLPRRSQSEFSPFYSDQRASMSQTGGLGEGSSMAGRGMQPSRAEDELHTLQAEHPNPEGQPPSIEAYNDLVAELQHKLSTKTLALETLQKEHERLLGAFQRQQTRSAAIQKKCTVADAEIVTLSAERDRLQEALDSSEAQVQDLIDQRDAVNKKLVSRVKEYSNIVQLAGQMENLSTLELKRWRERDASLRAKIVERDKAIEDMQQRLTVVESTEDTRTQGSGAEGDTDDFNILRRENDTLRQKIRDLEDALEENRQEVSRMEEIGRMLLHRNREGSDPASGPTGQGIV
ncbi:hypothetical protein ABW19_dt0204840 [Dactylella cylindrospora]|nr:hypothetical protein ABW19_dt0204840 [Dactylella cylindrospora]